MRRARAAASSPSARPAGRASSRSWKPRDACRSRIVDPEDDQEGVYGMSDRYLNLVNSAPGKAVASKLGLPRPVVLRRYQVGAPLLPGPALVHGAGLAGLVKRLEVEVSETDDGDTRWAALLYDATDVEAVSDLAGLRDFFAGVLRRLGPS